MEGLIVGLLALLLVAPIVALGLALAAASRSKRLEVELQAQQARTEVLARRLRELETAPGAEPESALAEPPPAASSLRSQPAPTRPIASPADEPPPPASPPALPPRLPTAPPEEAARPPARPPRPALDLEQLLGGRLLVWIGGLALSLAAAFLVKYSLDQGWVGPPIRVAMGIGFGLALIGVGEWLRRRSPTVAQASCAAGVAALFAALLAGTNLYALIPPVVGFAGLALTTAAAVFLSLRHGPFVAGLGLLGGFLTPALIRVGDPSPPLLFGYLFALQLGLLAVARRRGWWPLGVLTLVGCHVWAAAWLAGRPTGPHEAWLGLFLLGATAASVLATFGPESRELWGRVGDKPVAPWLGWLGGLLGLLLLAAAVHAGAFSNMEWGFLALLAAGGLVLARLDESYEPLPWLTAGAGAALMIDWSATSVPHEGRFVTIAAAYGGLHVLGAWLLGRGASSPARWSALSATATVAYFIVLWGALPDRAGFGPWGTLALVLAGLHVAAAALAARESPAESSSEGTTVAHAVGASVLVALASAIELEREWIAVAWSLQLPLLGWLDTRLGLNGLRRLAAGLGLVTAARLLLNPFQLDWEAGTTPFLGWPLWGFGVPLAAAAIAARLFRRRRDDRLVFGLELGACAGGAAWLALAVRGLFHEGRLDATRWTLAESGWLAALWLLVGGLVALGGRRFGRPALIAGGSGVAALGLAAAAFGPLLVQNPLWAPVDVAGPRVFNTLMVAHLLPAIACAAWAIGLRRAGRGGFSRLAAAASLVLTFAFLTLEVRHWFHHPRLNVGEPGSLELHAYSSAWILLGVALLAAGLKLGSKPLRQAALGVMLVAVAKVFLFDMRELQDLWRVLSFFGLGVSLMVLGYLYQRFVLRAAAS